MADYTVRVELNGATEADYATLHERMEANGFSRTVRASDGVLYQLPTAEYVVGGWPLTVQQIVAVVKHIADSVRPGAWVFATAATYWQWSGLPRV